MEVIFGGWRGTQYKTKPNQNQKTYIACLMVIRPKEGRTRITVRVDLMGKEIFRRVT